MVAVFETLIFMVIVGVLWYIFHIKNLFGLGAYVRSGKDAFRKALLFAIVAGIVFHLLGYLLM